MDFNTYYRGYYTYFFDHIDEFIALKDAIDATPADCSLHGGGTTSILKGKFELRFGDLITLYANGHWCDRAKNVFLFKMLQFPIGSHAVHVYGWDGKEKRYVKDPRGFPDTETLFEQAQSVVRRAPQTAAKELFPEPRDRLAALFRPLKEYAYRP